MRNFRVIPVLLIAIFAPALLAQHGTVNTSGTGTAGVRIDSDSAFPDVLIKLGNSTTSTFAILNSSDAAMLTVLANGDIGVGTTPTERLHVFENANTGSVILMRNPNPGTDTVAAMRAQSDVSALNIQAHSSARVLTRYGLSMAGWAELLHWQGNGLAIGTSHSAPVIFGTTSVERMRIHPTGDITVGGTNVQGKFTVWNTAINGTGMYSNQRTTVSATGNQNETGITSEVVEDIPNAGVTNQGGILGVRSAAWKIGPGTMTWATGGYFQTGNYPGTPGTVINAYGVAAHVLAGTGTVTNGHGVYVGDIEATNDYAFYQVAANDTNYFAGNVVIGGPPTVVSTFALSVQGNANFNGTVTGTNIKAHYQDVAEWVPSTTDLAPGTVVVLNRERDNEVMASTTSYDTTVAGVVSAQPGLSLGVEGEGKEQVATTGRVKVRVDARSKAIRVGDLLVTSDIPGTAMRSEPMNLNGRPFHQPGTIIGKALQALDGGVGEILVLLSMQ
jgi:hypothetical protein